MPRSSAQVRRVVVVYLVAGSVWIAISTLIADAVAHAVSLPAVALELGKGLGFVAATAAVLAVVLTRRQRSITESQERLHALAESVQEGLYIQRLDPTRRYEYVNPALQEITGVAAEEWYRNPDTGRRHAHPDDAERLEQALADPASTSWPLTFRWCRPDGDWRWLDIRETPVYDATGRLVAVQGVATDVTAREQREAALTDVLDRQRQAAEELERVQGMQRAFLQAVSHDLRSPLTVLLGLAETLDRHGDTLPLEEQRELRTRLRNSARRLSALLEDLLDVDRLTRGVIAPSRRRVDLTRLINDTVAHLDTSRHQVTIIQRPVVVDVDPAHAARIVENLVANALRHTPEGTEIEVRCRELHGGAEIVVEDAGPGLPEAAGDRIFEPFVRGGTSDDPTPGSGIGLALVREFARIHGGDAWHEPRPSGGTRFVVRLPSEGPGTGPTGAVPTDSTAD